MMITMRVDDDDAYGDKDDSDDDGDGGEHVHDESDSYGSFDACHPRQWSALPCPRLTSHRVQEPRSPFAATAARRPAAVGCPPSAPCAATAAGRG